LFLRTSTAAAALAAVKPLIGAARTRPLNGRPRLPERRFSSPAIEEVINTIRRRIADQQLADMFARCFPNALDTTIFFNGNEKQPDTFVITGDIDAMWLRDSSAQVQPYLQFARKDPKLQRMLAGVIRRQSRSILIDPYANAFTRTVADPPLSWARNDHTTMIPGVAERKWEIDSLCHVARLAYGYWKNTADPTPFDATWKQAAWKIAQTFREQQRKNDHGPYVFQRTTSNPTDTIPLRGYGNPARPVGMIFSMFRPSDDACIYPLFVPANLFAVQALAGLAEIAHDAAGDARLAQACEDLRLEVAAAVKSYGTVEHAEIGRIWAYEVDGYGNALMMDDANVPSLLALPYTGSCNSSDPLYRRTRQFALSSANPYFFRGTAAEGIGGPHIGLNAIWPMGITLRALTSTDDNEIRQCLRWLRDTTADTGFMHESFNKDNPAHYTRPWFAWANTLFGELILQLAEKQPGILQAAL
jgi:hypothetical protein